MIKKLTDREMYIISNENNMNSHLLAKYVGHKPTAQEYNIVRAFVQIPEAETDSADTFELIGSLLGGFFFILVTLCGATRIPSILTNYELTLTDYIGLLAFASIFVGIDIFFIHLFINVIRGDEYKELANSLRSGNYDVLNIVPIGYYIVESQIPTGGVENKVSLAFTLNGKHFTCSDLYGPYRITEENDFMCFDYVLLLRFKINSNDKGDTGYRYKILIWNK